MMMRTWKKLTAFMIAAAITVPGYAVFAEEADTEPAAETQAPAAEAPAPETEAPAPETEAPAPAPEETQAPSEEAPAPEETQEPSEEASEEAPVIQVVTEAEIVEEEPSSEVKDVVTEVQTEKDEQVIDNTKEPVIEAEETDGYRTKFRFENEEVVITVKVDKSEGLTKDVDMKIRKLDKDSDKYKEAKEASIRDLQTGENDDYIFYDMSFEKDGEEIDVEKVTVSVEFKGEHKETVNNTLYLNGEGKAKDVTDEEEVSGLKSIDFEM